MPTKPIVGIGRPGAGGLVHRKARSKTKAQKAAKTAKEIESTRNKNLEKARKVLKKKRKAAKG